MTDRKLAQMDPVKVTLESLERAGIPYKLYDKVRVEPSEERYGGFLLLLQIVGEIFFHEGRGIAVVVSRLMGLLDPNT